MLPWDTKEIFLNKVKSKGGFACHHAHFDKAYLINEEALKISQSSLQEKWKLYRKYKSEYTEEDLERRMTLCIENMISQGAKYCKTFVDADSIVGLLPVKVMSSLKEKYKGQIKLEIAIQPLEGVLNPKTQKTFIEACEIADVIGGLPDRDENPRQHVDFLMGLSKEMNKPIDIHVGQNNIPSEQETEMVVDRITYHQLEGRVNLVHAISLSCQPKRDRERIISKLRDTNTSVIVCPSAALSMKQQSEKYAPIHNSIAPVMELLEQDVNVLLGVDNIHDLFMPLVDGDLYFESRLLMEAIRYYDLDKIAEIVSKS
jgi:cytosine/adenosine deaminase-related metal-dependent hydrolase